MLVSLRLLSVLTYNHHYLLVFAISYVLWQSETAECVAVNVNKLNMLGDNVLIICILLIYLYISIYAMNVEKQYVVNNVIKLCMSIQSQLFCLHQMKLVNAE